MRTPTYSFFITLRTLSVLFSGKCIVNELLNKILDVALNRKFKFAHTEAAGDISQPTFMNRFGFEEKVEIVYDDFLFKSNRPFKSNDINKSIKLLVKEL